MKNKKVKTDKEIKILSKDEFLNQIPGIAKYNYPKFYEKFFLSFDTEEAMITSICLLIDVDKYYLRYKNSRNYMKKYLGVDDDKTESLYQQINMITELAIDLNMLELLK